MSVEIKRLAQRIEKSGYPVGGQLLADFGWSLEKGNLIPKRLPEDETVSKKEKPQDLLRAITIMQEYKTQSHTPELVTETWQTIWKVDELRVDLTINVPPCDRTKEELVKLEQEGRMLVYVPPELSTQENRHLLGKMFPRMRSYSTEKENPVTNELSQYGWVDVEASVDAPNINTTEEELRSLFASQGREGVSLNTYIIASQFSNRVKGHYFDEGLIWSRLLGSRYRGRAVSAGLYSDGDLDVRSLDPLARDPRLGGRSAGVKRT